MAKSLLSVRVYKTSGHAQIMANRNGGFIQYSEAHRGYIIKNKQGQVWRIGGYFMSNMI